MPVTLPRREPVSGTGLLMPMAFAAQLGGALTLIGTPPNLVVSEALAEATGRGLSFLALTPEQPDARATRTTTTGSRHDQTTDDRHSPGVVIAGGSPGHMARGP